MRDIVGHLLHAGDELGDARQHGVEVLDEAVELVPRAGEREAARKIAVGDLARVESDRIDPAQHAARDDQAADRADHGEPDQRGDERAPQDRPQRVALGEIVADQQAEAARQREDAGERVAALALHLVARLDHAILVDDAERQRRDVADDRLAGVGGEEVEPGARLLDALVDDLDEPRDAALDILLGEADRCRRRRSA